MSLRLIRPVLGRYAFVKMLEQSVQKASELHIVFLHKASRTDRKEGSVFFGYDPQTNNLGVVIRLYITGTNEFGDARFLSWKGDVTLFLTELSQRKDALGHNSVRSLVLHQEHLGQHVDLERALRNIDFKYIQEVLLKDPVIYKRAQKRPKYKPETDPDQSRLF